MVLDETTLPSGFATKGAVGLAVAIAWAVTTVWVDRDARRLFGRSSPWIGILAAVGAALFLGVLNWGLRVVEPLAMFLVMVCGFYGVLRSSRAGWQPRSGPLATVFGLLEDVAAGIGMVQGRARSIGASATPLAGRPRESVVLLKKGGEAYDSDDIDQLDRETSEAIRTVRQVMADAVGKRATDVHLEPRSTQEYQVRCRVDGLLKPASVLSPEAGKATISAIKVLADMDIAERRRPQDGSFAVLANGRRFDVRVNSGPTGFGEKVALRLLDPSGAILNEGLAGLGLRPSTLQTLRSVVHRSHGMLIVCGPTGSGKTTTVYAALSEIDGLVRNIVTIEDPIEYQLENVSQTAVNTSAELTFATILRAVLRQDPDVILVGEVRDKETAEIAMQAALTGHFVFTTLHANDAPTTVTRLLDIGIDASLIQSAVTAVLAQRLVRTLCPDCRVAYEPAPEELRRYGLPVGKVPRLYRSKGCPACGQTGYRGRTGIYELMLVDGAIRALLVGRPSLEGIREAAARQGMKTLRVSALQKAIDGRTTLDEVDRVVPDEAKGAAR
jgi:type II secretory ATPase GspE/PulE/Tfp pilus assembly ATPase PilB-like protein